MDANQIECPKCGTAISLTQALTAEIEQKFEAQFAERAKKAQAELNDRAKKLAAEREELAKSRDTLNKELEARLKESKAQLEKRLRDEIAGASKLEMEDLKAQLTDKAKKLDEAVQAELELRKKARELEEKEKHLEVEVQRKIDAEKSKISDEVGKRLAEDFRLKGAEKDKQLDDMRRQIEELKRKSEQSSQQMQGEVLELEMESLLKEQFPTDAIEPVTKGIRGADVIHRILLASGSEAGSIVWEMKRTKAWSDGWVPKLKEDQRAVKAEFAVIVTRALPKDLKGFGLVDGVWVTDISCAAGLAVALRQHVVQLHLAQSASANKGEKMEFLYGYLTGTPFRQRVEAIVEAFRAMREDLDREKRAFQKMWSARETQLNRVLESTAGMYGDIQGIVGATLPRLEALELDSGDDLLAPAPEAEKTEPLSN